MSADYMIHDRQANARPRRRQGQRIGSPIELLEDLAMLASRDADTLVHHFDHRVLTHGRKRDAQVFRLR